MPRSKSPLAHNYLRDILDRALQAEGGLRITCKNHPEAMALRYRLNYYRLRDRQSNATTYPEDHPLHQSSIWDRLVLTVGAKDGPDEAVLTIKPRALDHLIIEEIEPGGSISRLTPPDKP